MTTCLLLLGRLALISAIDLNIDEDSLALTTQKSILDEFGNLVDDRGRVTRFAKIGDDIRVDAGEIDRVQIRAHEQPHKTIFRNDVADSQRPQLLALTQILLLELHALLLAKNAHRQSRSVEVQRNLPETVEVRRGDDVRVLSAVG